MTMFEKMFESLQIKNLEFRNRIIMSPTVDAHSSPDGCPSRETAAYYAERAKGGAAAVIIEAAFIDDRESQSLAGQIGIYSDLLIPWFSEVADGIKQWGAIAVQQIFHAGRQTSPEIINGRVPIAPSALPIKAKGADKLIKCREMSEGEIEQAIEDFGEAARRVKAAGFDMVEIHGAHGYLLAEFWSPFTNKRTDRWGGSLENRARFPLEVVKRVRKAVGDNFPISYRLSGDEFVDGGVTIELSIELAKMLEEWVDVLHVSSAMVSETTFYNQSPMMYFPYAKNIHLCAAVKKAVHVPVIGVGAISRPDIAEQILREGKADLVAMGRALIADPEIPKKVMQGRVEDIKPCIRCNEFCLGRLFEKKVVRCAVNPLAGRESEWEVHVQPRKKKRILVAGGGPAGLEAARVGAERGHSIVLCEKGPVLGGLMNLASIPDFKKDIRLLIDYYRTQMEKLGVEVRLNTEVTPQYVRSEAPDALVVAIGSKAVVSEVNGINREFVCYAEDVLQGRVELGERVVVVGGGLVGCETALYIAGKKKQAQVTVIDMLPELASNVRIIPRLAILAIMDNAGVKSRLGCAVQEITEKGVLVIDKNFRKSIIEADSVVLAIGYASRRKESKELLKVIPEAVAAGDCEKVGLVGDAIRDGFNAIVLRLN